MLCSFRRALAEGVVFLVGGGGDGAEGAHPVRGAIRPTAGSFLPGIEQHQTQHGLVLRILGQPDGYQLLQLLLADLPRLVDDAEGDDERINVPGPGGAEVGQLPLLGRQIADELCEVAFRRGHGGDSGGHDGEFLELWRLELHRVEDQGHGCPHRRHGSLRGPAPVRAALHDRAGLTAADGHAA
jgi:hypothetical protein